MREGKLELEIVSSKSEVENKRMRRANQKRSEDSCPLSGRESYDRSDSPDRLQINRMRPFHATKKKSAFTKHVSSWSQ